LVVEAEPLGALNVQTVRPHDYTAEEVELLQLIADLAAGALAKAQLHDSQHRQLEELQMLAQLSAVVNAPQYLDDLLKIVTDMAAQSMNAAVCSLFMLNEEEEQLELRSARRRHGRYQHRPPLPLGQGVIGQVALTGQALNVPDVQSSDLYLGKELAQEEGLCSMLAVPLQVRGRIIGVLSCYTDTPHEFTEEQTSLFMTLANQTALAIENARLVTNAAVVREMHHRIKNNLQTVAMLMRLQMRDAETNKLSTAEVLELSISRIQSIAAVHEVLSEKGFRLVDVLDVLQRIAQMTQQSMTHPHQQIEIKVHGDTLALPSKAATSLALVVNELILNALEHGFHGRGQGMIDVSLGRSADEYIILVRDNGRGFPADLEQKQGLGLDIATTLVSEDLHGRIKFNHPPTGAEVSIRLPRNQSAT
ncbi:MAG: GAF domain-containing protein, partial [Anaerolineales bacterium]|nr:GAF domain-containing protein [Anaerolineales bacterium]